MIYLNSIIIFVETNFQNRKKNPFIRYVPISGWDDRGSSWLARGAGSETINNYKSKKWVISK